MAPRDSFTKAQADWIKALVPAYLAKIGALKPHLPGQPTPRDDTDISKFVPSQWASFEVKFGEELGATSEGESVWKTRFFAKFRNAKSQSLLKSGAKPTKAVLFFRPPPDSNRGRDLFREQKTDVINLSVTQKRTTTGEDSKAHAGLFQRELKQEWDALSEDEQREWHDKASSTAVSDATNIERRLKLFYYSNQEAFSDMITEALESLIGDGAHQVGPATFLVLYGMRKPNNKLALGAVGVRSVGSDADFLAEYSDAASVIDHWNNYCAVNLPNSYQAADQVVVSRDSEGRPVLPLFDPELDPAAVGRSLLTGFLEVMWEDACLMEAGTSSLPWEDLAAHPEDYIEHSIIPPGVTLARPSTMSLLDFYATMDAIRVAAASAAAASQPFLVFRTREAIQSARQIRTVHNSHLSSPLSSPKAMEPHSNLERSLSPELEFETTISPVGHKSPSHLPRHTPPASNLFPTHSTSETPAPLPVISVNKSAKERGSKRKIQVIDTSSEPVSHTSNVSPPSKKKAKRSTTLIPKDPQPRPTRVRKQVHPYDASTSIATVSAKPKSSKPGWDYIPVTDEPIR
ncbi:hypothetical protein FIBSPDRAFT_905497 [Athelia psychrophila]|uniref:Uncharacterized protein n=1 Tax=Athelia psychrophila TaxID=1759441 RepID=A0A167TDS2_9AGAM|nr:hypothetical protein FIBSPDRAFT_905497 [Fibularhizoctonia sp. CBS 109695]